MDWEHSTKHGARADYARSQIQEALIGAHRASWLVHRGHIPTGMCVLHKCDNPSCCNPAHLFLGTKADNTRDMIAKGRQKRGEDLPQSKLTRKTVAKIRASKETHAVLATRFGVSQPAISMIRSGKRWV
jgi:hypothetical protein